MNNTKSVRPEDILPDGVDSTTIQGKVVRKGTVAAFLANVVILEDPNSSPAEKANAKSMLQELAPDVVTIGLHQHVTFKNPEAENILLVAAKHQHQK